MSPLRFISLALLFACAIHPLAEFLQREVMLGLLILLGLCEAGQCMERPEAARLQAFVARVLSLAVWPFYAAVLALALLALRPHETGSVPKLVSRCATCEGSKSSGCGGGAGGCGSAGSSSCGCSAKAKAPAAAGPVRPVAAPSTRPVPPRPPVQVSPGRPAPAAVAGGTGAAAARPASATPLRPAESLPTVRTPQPIPASRVIEGGVNPVPEPGR